MKGKPWVSNLWVIIGLAATAALLVWAFLPEPLEVETGQVSVGRFERSVREEGKTRLRQRYVIAAPVAGYLSRISFKAGDPVTRGTVLATLAPTAPALLDERARQEQRERIGALAANVRRAATNVERARSALAQAGAELKRIEALAGQGFVSPVQGETARFNLDFRRRELEAQQQEEHALRHELEQARIVLNASGSGTHAADRVVHSVLAPVSGRILKVLRDSEGPISAGAALVEIGDPATLEVTADLLTEEAATIQPGAPARLANWGGPQSLDARVRLIEPAAFTKVSALGVEEQRVKVVLDLLTPAEQRGALGDGFKVDASILVMATDNSTLVPISALFPHERGFAVFVVEAGTARRATLEVLARNGTLASVKTTLKPGTPLVLYPPAGLADGAKVKVLARPG